MEVGSLDLTIAGDRGNVQRLEKITPAEAALLLRTHGPSSINNIRVQGRLKEARESIAERNRLLTKWKGCEEQINDMWTEFGGAFPKTFKELCDRIGLGMALFATGPDREPIPDPDDVKSQIPDSEIVEIEDDPEEEPEAAE